jgi:hypothetical protein
MEWLYLLVAVSALALLWAAIKGADWLIEYTKRREHFIRLNESVAKKMTAAEEAEYLAEMERRERIDVMVNWEEWPTDFDKASPKFQREFNKLSANDLCEVMLLRREKNIDIEQNADSIRAKQSSLRKPLESRLAVTNGKTVAGIKAPRDKQSKKEEKIFNQIKKRYNSNK